MKQLKRVTYISNFGKHLGMKDIESIGEVSVRNNKRDGLTGSLVTLREIFYQILEGEADKVDACLDRINTDPRHTNIFVLKVENIEERSYGKWSMKTVILDENTDEMMQPLKNVLDSLQHTHRVLEKFAPQTIIRGLQAGENPLEWDFRSVEKIILFSDLVSSTTFTEVLPLSDMTQLLSAYYEIINHEITAAGGTISKLTGDGLMAYFDGDQADQAVSAALNTLERLAEYRARAPYPYSPLVYAGIGLSSGSVVTGNIGSIIKRDYTLLGDPVNTAARLEGITRRAGHSLIFDESVNVRLSDPTATRKVGLYRPRGKQQAVNVFTARPALTKFDQPVGQIGPRIRQLLPAQMAG